MSEERKPFAEVVHISTNPETGHELRIAGAFIEGAYHDRADVLQEQADAINAAVEERERQLRGRNHALRMIAAELGDASAHLPGTYMVRRTERLGRAVHAFREHMLDAIDDEDEYVTGHVACGLAFDLGIEQGRAVAFRPLLDTLLEQGGFASELAYDLARALGLLKFETPGLGGMAKLLIANEFTDDDLRTECRRRGWHPEMGLVPRLTPRAAVPAIHPAGDSPDNPLVVDVNAGERIYLEGLPRDPPDVPADEAPEPEPATMPPRRGRRGRR
jgi:hypothetical protein